MGDAQRRPVLETRRRRDDAGHLLAGQHDRQPALLAHDRHTLGIAAAAEREAQEETQCRGVGVDRSHAEPLRLQVKQERSGMIGGHPCRTSRPDNITSSLGSFLA